jgi:hypothetical protein
VFVYHYHYEYPLLLWCIDELCVVDTVIKEVVLKLTGDDNQLPDNIIRSIFDYASLTLYLAQANDQTAAESSINSVCSTPVLFVRRSGRH